MTAWTALVPLKQGGDRKSRLATRLSQEERAVLADALAAHVVDCLHETKAVGDIILLAPTAPSGLKGRWLCDHGHGLNAELERARATLARWPLLVIHGDLPFLKAGDIDAMLAAAHVSGAAIAPDRHHSGTNALAIVEPCGFAFAFGADSFARHSTALGSSVTVVSRLGLSFDLDTPADLDRALALNRASRINQLPFATNRMCRSIPISLESDE